jgi:predicted RND superfamily exporter protein
VHDLLYSLLSAAVVIFFLVALLFRSIRVGLIAVLPNLTPLTLTLGYMGLRGLDLNMSSAITFVISLGVAVDGTIHFLSRFLREVRYHDVAEAVQLTLQGTGLAIAVAVVLIIGGCSMLQFSNFVPTRTFAELTSVTMAGALLGDLMLLPALLLLCWKPKRQRHAAPSPENGNINSGL